MKKTVLVFGVISGLIMSILMVSTIPFLDRIGYDRAAIVGYTGIVIAFLMVFFGIRSYRENMGGGQITFVRGFVIGVMISIISSLFYVLTWEVVYFKFMPGFLEGMTRHAVDKQIAAGASQDAINKTLASFKELKVLYDNPLYNGLITFTEPFPVGLIVSLLSAVILRRRLPRTESAVPVHA